MEFRREEMLLVRLIFTVLGTYGKMGEKGRTPKLDSLYGEWVMLIIYVSIHSFIHSFIYSLGFYTSQKL